MAPTGNRKMTCVTCLVGLSESCIAYDKEKCHPPIGGWSPRLQTCVEPNFIRPGVFFQKVSSMYLFIRMWLCFLRYQRDCLLQ